MNWDAIGAIGELLGALVVVATLVYLSRQVRESNKHASSEVERHIQEKWNEMLMYWSKDDKTRDICRRGHRSYLDLEEDEKVVFLCCLALGVNHLEMVLRMNRKGLVDDDIVTTYGALTISMLRSNGGRELWKQTGKSFPVESKKYIDSRINESDDIGSIAENLPMWVAD